MKTRAILENEPCFGDIEPRQTNVGAPYDIVQLSIQNRAGLNYTTFVMPEKTPRDEWDNLGVPSEILEVSPSLSEVTEMLIALTQGSVVWWWARDRDAKHLKVLDKDNPLVNVQDLMFWASPLVSGYFNHKYHTWQYASLESAADKFGLTFDLPGHHDAAADAAMLMKLYDVLLRVDVHFTLRDTEVFERLHPKSALWLAYDGGDKRDVSSTVWDDVPF